MYYSRYRLVTGGFVLVALFCLLSLALLPAYEQNVRQRFETVTKYVPKLPAWREWGFPDRPAAGSTPDRPHTVASPPPAAGEDDVLGAGVDQADLAPAEDAPLQSDTATAAKPAPTRPVVKTSPVDAAAGAHPTRYVFAFGDSLTSTGFKWVEDKPSPANPFGNPAPPRQHSSGGPNWLEQLIEKSPQNTMCYNFAEGAAVVDINIVRNFTEKMAMGTPHDFAPWTGDDALGLIFLGVNDCTAMQVYLHDNTPQNLTDYIFESYFERVRMLRDGGLRKFLFMGVPPLYRFRYANYPERTENYENLTISCNYWNKVLQQGAKKLELEEPKVQADVLILDEYFIEAIDNPTKYGAANASCRSDDGHTCLWVDGIHPAAQVHGLVAGGVLAKLKAMGFWP